MKLDLIIINRVYIKFYSEYTKKNYLIITEFK